MWNIKVGVFEIDWMDGKITSFPPQIAGSVHRYIDARPFIGMTPTGPFVESSVNNPYVAYTATVDVLYTLFGLTMESAAIAGDYEWPVTDFDPDKNY